MIGEELPKEAWINAAMSIAAVAQEAMNALQKMDRAGQSRQEVEAFVVDMQLAYTAMRYVAECATDKCRFILVPDGSKMAN